MTIHRAKKSLGQNFLKSDMMLGKIIESGEISSDDVILEIGPGKGTLTEKLLERAGKVIAVEKDRELFELLKTKFEKEIKSGSLVLLNEDILKFNTKPYLATESPSYKIIANIPYNITGAILKKFLTNQNQPSRMVLMVQHEVARRIVARDGKESILSISVKVYGQPKLIAKVPARYFSPAPKVDSAIIDIRDISREIFENNAEREKKFWKLVKTGFAHKRKKLSGNLKNIIPTEKLTELGLSDQRAEDLPISDWLALSEML